MKSLKKLRKITAHSSFGFYMALMGLALFFVSCELTTEEDLTAVYEKENDLSITQYIETHPERFSILYDIMDTTGLNHLFRTYGDYTFLAPTDSAFNNYFKEKGKSLNDFTLEELDQLVRYHIFDIRNLAGGFNSGIVDSKTLTLDYMVSDRSANGSNIILNKEARILSQDVLLPNGILHVIDKVVENPEMSIYEWFENNSGEYSIFLEALKKTGLDEVVNEVVNPENGNNNFYTCFATPDNIYAENSINSFADLAAQISPNDDNYTDSTNNLKSFIASHFVTDILSISDATEDHIYFGTIGGATIKFGLRPNTADVALYYKTVDFPEGLAVDEFNSNNLTSNGIIHVMDTTYQVTKSFERIPLEFVFLDVPGIPYDSLYDYGITLWEEKAIMAKETGNNGAEGSETWLLGQWSQYWPRPGGPKHIPFEKTDGRLTLNAPYSGNIKGDHHRNNEYKPIFFTFDLCDDLLDVTRKLPYIIPGKYRLINYCKTGNERPSVKHYWDGEPIGGIVNLQTAGLDFQDVELGIVEIGEDETEHFLRIQALTTGKGFYVSIKLIPVD